MIQHVDPQIGDFYGDREIQAVKIQGIDQHRRQIFVKFLDLGWVEVYPPFENQRTGIPASSAAAL